VLLFALLALTGCKKQDGEPCDKSSSCEGNLICAEWTDAHEDVIGDCGGKRCCTSDDANDKAKRAADCAPLIGVIEAARQPATHTLKVPRELEQLSIVVKSHVATFKALELSDPALAKIRDDYVELSNELSDAAKQRAFHVNRFDGPNVFKQIDRMKAVANRESDLVDDVRKRCKSGDRPEPAFGGPASD
jgi:hypothetical protein